ncbi:MAG: Ig-like domain-containing protein, partial [archaeon]
VNLSSYGYDREDAAGSLAWAVSGVNTTLFTAGVANQVLTLTTVANKHGSDTITLTLTDTGGLADTQNITVTINPVNDKPVLAGIVNQTVVQTEDLNISLSAADADGDVLTYAASMGTMNSANGKFSWTPSGSTEGYYDITFGVSDSNGGADSQAARITVVPAIDIALLDVNVDGQSNVLLSGKNRSVISAVRPGSQVTLSMGLAERTQAGIEDVIVTATVSSLGIVRSTKRFNLELNCPPTGQCSYLMKTLAFQIPTNVAEGLYRLEISTSGVKAVKSQTAVSSRIILFLNVDKVMHNIGISQAQAGLTKLTCIRNTQVNATLINLGWASEDDINLTISNSALGIRIVDDGIALATGQSYNNVYPIDVSTAAAGTYTLVVRAGYNNDESFAQQQISIQVSDCTLPDKVVNEDTLPEKNWIDLWAYTTDGYTGPELTYTIASQSNPSLIGCQITKDAVTGANRYIDCAQPAKDMHGYSDVNISISAGGVTRYDVLRVTVTPVNDIPRIAQTPQAVSFLEDGYSDSLDLDVYFISDDEDTASNITWTAASSIFTVKINSATHVANITAPADWNGTGVITFTARDSGGATNSTTAIVTVIAVNDDAPVITMTMPGYNPLADEMESVEFKANATDPDKDPLIISWYQDSVFKLEGNFYTFKGDGTLKSYNITAVVTDGLYTVQHEWNLTTSNLPVSKSYTGTIGRVNLSNVGNVSGITIEHSQGKIDFGSRYLNLSRAVDLDRYIVIASNRIGIDSTKLQAFSGVPATLTINNLNYNVTPRILYNTQFGASAYQLCPPAVCSGISYNSTTGVLRFAVTGFSEYTTESNTTAYNNTNPVITSTAVTSATLNATYTYDVEATDADGDTLTYALVTSPSGMTINTATGLIQWNPTAISSFNVAVRVTDGRGGQADQGYTISVARGSKLRIADLDVKVDSKTDKNMNDGERISEDAGPKSEVTFNFEIENLFTRAEDVKIEDVIVTITIKDIDDGDDLEEETDKFDIKRADSEKDSLVFDLPLRIEEDTYDVTISAEGDDERGITHTAEMTVYLRVDKNTHEIILYRAELGSPSLICARSTSIDVTAVNIGTKDEDDVVLTINSNALGIGIRDTFVLEEDIGSDINEFRKFVRVDAANDLPSGTYPIEVRLYRDTSILDDQKTLDLVVEDCVTQPQITTPIPPAVEIVYGQPDTSVPTLPTGQVVTLDQTGQAEEASFKQSTSYYLLLIIANIILVGLVVFAVGAVIIRRR